MQTRSNLSKWTGAWRSKITMLKWGCRAATASLLLMGATARCQTAPIVVPTMSDLRALSVSGMTNDTVVLVNDYYTPTSYRGRGGGFFRWKLTNSMPSTPVMADDGGRFISPNSNTSPGGIWERLLQGEFPNVKMWGARGDGVSNDYQAIQNAINACGFGWAGELVIPSGTYIVTNTIVFWAQLHIRGEGNGNNTMILMPAGIQKDIFRTANADNALNGGPANWDSFLIFENLQIKFDGTAATRNKSNSCLVVCKPCEGHVIRNLITINGAFGIRCLGGGAPGLRVRDCTLSDAAIAGISFEPVPGAGSSGGDPVSLIGVSGDMRYDDCAATASLIRFYNVVTSGRITEIKAEGDFGGGVVQYQYPPISENWGMGPMAMLEIENASYNAGVTYSNNWYVPDFVVIKGQQKSAAVSLKNLGLFAVRDLINDQVTGRQVEADTDSLGQNTCRVGLSYDTSNDGGPQGTFTTLTKGQTAIAYLYATNAGWYRVMQPQGVGTTHIAGKLVISLAGRESDEIQVDVNPYSGNPAGAWLNVTRTMGTNSWNPPVVTQARGYYYYDTAMSAYWGYVDIYVGNPLSASLGKSARMTIALDVNGYEPPVSGQTCLTGIPISVSSTLPSGAVSTTVNTYR